MKFLIIGFLTFFLSSNSSELHDSVTATFNVIEKGHVIMLEIDFDTDNYLSVNPSKDRKITKEKFSEYLNKTTNWAFDGEVIIPEVLSIQVSGHHTKVVCFLSKEKEDIKSVKIKNEFLLSFPSHSNIVMLDLNDVFKDFRLHQKRREITVVYD